VLTKVPVTIGMRDDRTGNWQVLAGLSSGDTLMRTPGSNFKNGQRVEMNTAAKAVASASVEPAQAVNKGN
jgi:hypothetical protein